MTTTVDLLEDQGLTNHVELVDNLHPEPDVVQEHPGRVERQRTVTVQFDHAVWHGADHVHASGVESPAVCRGVGVGNANSVRRRSVGTCGGGVGVVGQVALGHSRINQGRRRYHAGRGERGTGRQRGRDAGDDNPGGEQGAVGRVTTPASSLEGGRLGGQGGSGGAIGNVQQGNPIECNRVGVERNVTSLRGMAGSRNLSRSIVAREGGQGRGPLGFGGVGVVVRSGQQGGRYIGGG